MEDEKIKKGIKEIRKIEMTYDEKRLVFDNLLNLIETRGEGRPDLNRGSFYSFFFSPASRHLVYYVLIPLIIILSGGGVAFASQDSLPGDLLYPVKTKIIEPAQSVLSFSSEAKARHESTLLSKRLIEAEILVKEGRLDTKNGEKINKLIRKHTVSLGKSIEKIDGNDADKKIDEDMEKLNKEIDTRIKNIEEVKSGGKINLKKQEGDNTKTEKDIVKKRGRADSEIEKTNNKQSEYNDKKESTQKKKNTLE